MPRKPRSGYNASWNLISNKVKLMHPDLNISQEVQEALNANMPIVALESTVISHGLAYPTNIETALLCENAVREQGAIPATLGIIDGNIRVGLNKDEIEILAHSEDVIKVSRRDMGIVTALKLNGGTTVATTLMIATWAGIDVFATGGFGGVHRGDEQDVSADLPELGRQTMVLICAGAKSILDVPRTLEYLETQGVPVLGYQTDSFPAFYSRTSPHPITRRVDDAKSVAQIAKAHQQLQLGSIVVAVPLPEAVALSDEEMESAIEKALLEATEQGITGKDITPFVLARMGALTSGRSITANVALLEQNASVAAQIATQIKALP